MKTLLYFINQILGLWNLYIIKNRLNPNYYISWVELLETNPWDTELLEYYRLINYHKYMITKFHLEMKAAEFNIHNTIIGVNNHVELNRLWQLHNNFLKKATVWQLEHAKK